MGKLKISGLGCTLLDFVYNGIDFNGPGFQKYRSRKAGDGGLTPGQLVFLEELEKFAGKEFEMLKLQGIGNLMPQISEVRPLFPSFTQPSYCRRKQKSGS